MELVPSSLGLRQAKRIVEMGDFIFPKDKIKFVGGLIQLANGNLIHWHEFAFTKLAPIIFHYMSKGGLNHASADSIANEYNWMIRRTLIDKPVVHIADYLYNEFVKVKNG